MLLFTGELDGEFVTLMVALARLAGPVFDAIFTAIDHPPQSPVADSPENFAEWMVAHLIAPLSLYSAYPNVTAGDLRALADAAQVVGTERPRALLVVLPTRSWLACADMKLLPRGMSRTINQHLTAVGTTHFAQFIPLENDHIGIIAIHDGSFDECMEAFARNVGPLFDIIFEFTRNPPPFPCSEHLPEFRDFAVGARRESIGLYEGYPGLAVRDIQALIAGGGKWLPAMILPARS